MSTPTPDDTDALSHVLHVASLQDDRLYLPADTIINGVTYFAGAYELRWVARLQDGHPTEAARIQHYIETRSQKPAASP